MIKETHTAECPEQYLTAIGLDPEKVIYFDIETTGLKASTSQLYMIGWAVRARSGNQNNLWTVTQILAESYAEERLLLSEFSDVMRRYDAIIEFNGDRFDLPYIREKCAGFGLPDPFDGLRTVDLYQLIRPCKTLLSLDRLNQKSVEQFLHITREDPYNGGQLIDVYRSVRGHSSEDMDGSIRSLFLHNYEDVIGMMKMTPLISYSLISCCTAPVSWNILDSEGNPVQAMPSALDQATTSAADRGNTPAADQATTSAADCDTALCLKADYSLDVPVPRKIEADMGPYRIEVSGNLVTVAIPLMRSTLYHYFPDYRNYYYLPEEDTAIHKSVACFVEPAYRRKATAQNCYVKKEGFFLPQKEERFQPVFHIACKEKISWFELKQEFLNSPDALSEYIHSLI